MSVQSRVFREGIKLCSPTVNHLPPSYIVWRRGRFTIQRA